MFQAQATLSLTVENRASITDILLEELKRQATAGVWRYNFVWSKVTAFMTDSIAKNLYMYIDSIAATLNPTLVPFHLPYERSTCEVFDKGNNSVLKAAEKHLGLRQCLKARMPALRPFLTCDKCLTGTALEALNKLHVI